METYIIIDNPKRWNLKVPGVTVVKAQDYLTDKSFSLVRRARVFNMCRTYRYQSVGYYVSLIAAARGHYPMPSVTTIQDMHLDVVIRQVSHELDVEIQKSLKSIHSERFELSCYFGSNVARRHNRLAKTLFNMFPVPFLRVFFRKEDQRWAMTDVRVLSTRDIPEHHHEFVIERIIEFIGRRIRKSTKDLRPYRYEMAILASPDENTPPSNPAAIEKFRAAADRQGIGVELITRQDYAQLDRYDALFIRDTTSVDHYTYRFARRAEAVGLAVIDDPLSILRCTNKIYLKELLTRNRIPIPSSEVIAKHTVHRVDNKIGYPCVVKIPDSSYSQGVFKFVTRDEFMEATAALFKKSDLLLVQAFVPTAFDWRVGIINRQPLYVCKYHMAKQHWQIYNHGIEGDDVTGMAETLAIGDAPPAVINAAVQSAGLIGNGLYGVDLKEIDGNPVVIEINDNPSIDNGVEDLVLKDELYDTIIREFIRRLDAFHGKQ